MDAIYFDQLNVGDSCQSPGRTVTETDIVNFAGLSGDFVQLHTDAEYCKDTHFGRRMAHGLLGMSIASGLALGPTSLRVSHKRSSPCSAWTGNLKPPSLSTTPFTWC